MKRTLFPILFASLALACGDKDDAGETGHTHDDTAEADADTDTDTDTDTDADFVFSAADPDDYERVDRAGMPAVGTAVISSKDDYNQADPVDDAKGVFAGEIVDSLDFLHGALDQQLIDLGLAPCDVLTTCLDVAAPLVLPDTIKVDMLTVSSNPNFPNGRKLEDPVIDVTLAVVLLDIASGAHGVTDLVGLNPTENDVAFSATFPYLADPQ